MIPGAEKAILMATRDCGPIQPGVDVVSAHASSDLEDMLRRHTRVPRLQPPITAALAVRPRLICTVSRQLREV